MKIKSTKGKTYDVDLTRDGENRMPCPECSDSRKHAKAKSFSFNKSKGAGHCMNCGASFYIPTETVQKKEYTIPQWKNKTKLTDQAASWMRGRLILDDVLNDMNISSAVEWMPQIEAKTNVICFPYYRGKELVNVKYRDGVKHFKVESGAELIFYNLNCAKDSKELVIVEGEIDCLSFLQSGVKNVVSVPNGAGSTSLDYIENSYNEIQHIEKFYIGVDNDAAGSKLRDELIRRLGSERCAIINYGDCKDPNEFLTRNGQGDLRGLISKAKDVKIDGVFDCDDMYESIYQLYKDGFQPGAGIKIGKLDESVTWETGRLAIVTGIPGHGKSEIVDFIVARLNIIHGWKAAYFSPENHPISYHYGKLASKISGKSFENKYLNEVEFKQVFDYMRQNFYFISPEEDLTIDSILEKAKYLVRKHGIKILTIDPYNKMEHMMERWESETQYISRFLDKLTNFARINGVLVFLVAHPKKMQNRKDDSDLFEIPTLYDISGSANFYNKADYGLTVYRNWKENSVVVIVQKVKFKHWGTGGAILFRYNHINGRIHLDSDAPDYETYVGRKWKDPVQIQMVYNDPPEEDYLEGKFMERTVPF